MEYFDTSSNGNIRYSGYIAGVQIYTGVDSCLGSSLKNYAGKFVSVKARVIRGKLTIDSQVEVIENPDAEYYRGQFAVIRSNLDFKPTMQIRGVAGCTKWLNITPAQLDAIEEIMTDPVLAGNHGQ